MLLTEFINQYSSHNIPFVCYRLPLTTEPTTLVGGSFSKAYQPDKNQPIQFVFAPFDTENEPIQFFNPEKTVTGWDIGEGFFNRNTPELLPLKFPDKPVITDYETYTLHALKFIHAMQKHEVEKVVLSRVKEYALKNDFRAGEIFRKACTAYPAAFVYLLNDGKGQVWFGATPETLLKVTAGNGSTMALAGTQAIDNQPLENMVWGEKEIKEHEFVIDFIREILQKNQVENLQEGKLKSVQAGKFAHLQTDFTFTVTGNTGTFNIAKALHPTPAVCGLPQKEAFRRIISTENHNRSYYTGFLGIQDNQDNCQFFVNLRCMQIIDNKAYIYVGGGLTAQSDPLKEWNETELKAGTLLTLFE
ncbi:MAG: isochorismate synthase [Bacteroidales bacterium]|nr:isochorismate synthase [Bacteroidales bacterium]